LIMILMLLPPLREREKKTNLSFRLIEHFLNNLFDLAHTPSSISTFFREKISTFFLKLFPRCFKFHMCRNWLYIYKKPCVYPLVL
jgi:hypothetical protein